MYVVSDLVDGKKQQSDDHFIDSAAAVYHMKGFNASADLGCGVAF